MQSLAKDDSDSKRNGELNSSILGNSKRIQDYPIPVPAGVHVTVLSASPAAPDYYEDGTEHTYAQCEYNDVVAEYYGCIINFFDTHFLSVASSVDDSVLGTILESSHALGIVLQAMRIFDIILIHYCICLGRCVAPGNQNCSIVLRR